MEGQLGCDVRLSIRYMPFETKKKERNLSLPWISIVFKRERIENRRKWRTPQRKRYDNEQKERKPSEVHEDSTKRKEEGRKNNKII